MANGNSDKKTKGKKKCITIRTLKISLLSISRLITINIVYLINKQYYNCRKYLKMKHILYTLKKLIKLHWVVMMVKDYKHLIILHQIHMAQMQKGV